jgi:hypothetical protein
MTPVKGLLSRSSIGIRRPMWEPWAKFTPLRVQELARLIVGDDLRDRLLAHPARAGDDRADDDLIGPAEPRPASAGWQAQQGDLDSEMLPAGITQRAAARPAASVSISSTKRMVRAVVFRHTGVATAMCFETWTERISARNGGLSVWHRSGHGP